MTSKSRSGNGFLFVSKLRFHASQVHGTPQKHEWHYLCCRNYTLKQFPTLFAPWYHHCYQ